MEQERQFDYSKVDRNGLVSHIAKFVSGLWQIHPFGEGNTRTTAVFTILYLRSMGFDVTNDLFAKHSWYFRNALVRANYQNVQKGIMRNSEYLERFFRNLILGETNELRNRYMVVNVPEELRAEQVQRIDRTSTEQAAVQVTEQVRALLLALSNEQLSLKVLMEIVKSIDGESRSETSSDIFGELYNPRFRSRFSQGAISRQAQSPSTEIFVDGKRISII